MGVKATFRYPHANNGIWINAQPLHPFGIRTHMGLTDQHRIHTNLSEVITNGQLPDLKREAIPGRAMA